MQGHIIYKGGLLTAFFLDFTTYLYYNARCNFRRKGELL